MDLAKNTFKQIVNLSSFDYKDSINEIQSSFNTDDANIPYENVLPGEKTFIRSKVVATQLQNSLSSIQKKYTNQNQRIPNKADIVDISGSQSGDDYPQSGQDTSKVASFEAFPQDEDYQYLKARKDFIELIQKNKEMAKKDITKTRKREKLFETVKDIASTKSGVVDKIYNVKTVYDIVTNNVTYKEKLDLEFEKKYNETFNTKNINEKTSKISNQIVSCFNKDEKLFLLQKLQSQMDDINAEELAATMEQQTNKMVPYLHHSNSNTHSRNPSSSSNETNSHYSISYDSPNLSISSDFVILENIKSFIILFVRVSFMLLYFFIPIMKMLYTKFMNNEFIGFNLKNFKTILDIFVKLLSFIDRRLSQMKSNPNKNLQTRPVSSNIKVNLENDQVNHGEIDPLNKFRDINEDYVNSIFGSTPMSAEQINLDDNNTNTNEIQEELNQEPTSAYTNYVNSYRNDWKGMAVNYVVDKYVFSNGKNKRNNNQSASLLDVMDEFVTKLN